MPETLAPPTATPPWWRRPLLAGLVLAVVFEAVTCLMRFGLGLESHRDGAFLASATFGLRIHHGYVGLLLLVAAALGRVPPPIRGAVLAIGLGLALSDALHHFAVLWPITGSPEFHLAYG